VISHSPSKKSDALSLGANNFILNDSEKWHEDHKFKFDFILNTADMTHTFDIATYLGLLKVNGVFHQVGLPDESLPQFGVGAFMPNGSSIGASHIGSRDECLGMLKLVAENWEEGKEGKWPMVETVKVGEEGCKEAVTKVKGNKVRYRVTLTGFEEVFGTA
jgi:alcohol dehydrogenase (NADP+)